MMLQMDLLPYLGGICLSLLSTVMFNLAPVLQKTALSAMPEIKANNLWKSFKAMFTSKKWLLAMLISTGGGILYVLAIEIAGITIVQPLLNFGFIVLVIMANRLLGEKIDTRSKVAIGILIGMPVFIAFGAVSTPHGITAYDALIIFSVICVILIGASILLSGKVPILWAFTTGTCLGVGSVFLQWFTLVFFDAIQSTGNAFVGIWIAIIPFALMLVFTMLPNLLFSQIGLQKNPAARFNPLAGTINMIVTVIGGILIFDQAIGNWISYGIGIVFGVIGIIMLSKHQIAVNTPAVNAPAPSKVIVS
jgi:drug/metabolite transporter (DMT)-like permease